MKKVVVCLAALFFCTVAAQNAVAQSNLGLKAMGGTVGLVSPESGDATAGFGAFADLGTLAPQVRLTTHLDYWSHSEDAFGGASASVSDLALSARGTYLFSVASPRIQPYAGVGLGLHFLSAKVEVPGFLAVESSDTKLGLELGGGFEAPMGPKTAFLGELWYGVVSDFNQLALRVGLSYKVGP